MKNNNQREHRTPQQRGVQGEMLASVLLGNYPHLMVYRPEHFASYDDGGVDLIVRNTRSQRVFTVSVKTHRPVKVFENQMKLVSPIILQEFGTEHLEPDVLISKKQYLFEENHVLMIIFWFPFRDQNNEKYISYSIPGKDIKITAQFSLLIPGDVLANYLREGIIHCNNTTRGGGHEYKLSIGFDNDGMLLLGQPQAGNTTWKAFIYINNWYIFDEPELD